MSGGQFIGRILTRKKERKKGMREREGGHLPCSFLTGQGEDSGPTDRPAAKSALLTASPYFP